MFSAYTYLPLTGAEGTVELSGVSVGWGADPALREMAPDAEWIHFGTWGNDDGLGGGVWALHTMSVRDRRLEFAHTDPFLGEYIGPYLFATDDFGRTWRNLGGAVPADDEHPPVAHRLADLGFDGLAKPASQPACARSARSRSR